LRKCCAQIIAANSSKTINTNTSHGATPKLVSE
jgi:hypothetical protein